MIRTLPLVLDVDDDEAGRYAVSRQLKQAGYDVIGAATGEAGLRLAAAENPDLILLDVRLPDIDGFEVCRRLRENPATADIPVVQMSASYVDVSSRIKGLQNGADAYLTEPVEPPMLVATIHSMLRMKRAEMKVQQQALQWQTTFDAIQDGVALLDGEGAVIQHNKAFDNLSSGALQTKEIFERSRAAGARVSEEITRDERTLHISMDPVRNGDREFGGAVCILTDITEKKKFETQLRHTAKLESIGVLAGGIAHDFNNLLTGILGNSRLLLDAMPEQAPERETVYEIVKASESAAHLTRQILAYSGKGKFFVTPVNLSALALESRTLIRHFVPARVDLRYEVSSHLALIDADPGQMQQLITNLIINAAESFGPNQKGAVIVSTAAEHLDQAFFHAGETPAPGEYVTLTVADNGAGMDENLQARIFDPFFTTKFTGRGLGLSAVHGILQGHKGFLRLQSAAGVGSTFKLYFPVAKSAQPERTAPRNEIAPYGSGTILVVDDESTVRNFARVALERRGYKVLLAHNGEAAVELFRKLHRDINVVLLDLTMPVMNGEEAFDHLRNIAPDIAVILSSGFSHQVAAERFHGKGLSGFLEKPYTGAQLGEAIACAVAGAALP
jgi:CheY-like chemotaxis protein/nitrogen-specific signal transduction histidine kinase